MQIVMPGTAEKARTESKPGDFDKRVEGGPGIVKYCSRSKCCLNSENLAEVDPSCHHSIWSIDETLELLFHRKAHAEVN